MTAGGEIGWFIAIVIAAIVLDWLWVFKFKKWRKSFHSSKLNPKAGRQFSIAHLAAPYSQFIRRNNWIPILLLLVAVCLAYAGQKGLMADHIKEPGIWYLLCAGAVFTVSSLAGEYTSLAPVSNPPESEHLISSPVFRRFFLILAPLVSAANVLLLLARKNGSSYWDIFALWIISVLLFVLPFFPRIHFRRPSLNIKRQWGIILPLVVILLIGFAARFYQLSLIPFVMENDEGIGGVAALNVLDGHITNMFRTSGGNGTLLFFIMALQVKIFGQTQLALRIGTACVGFITLIAIYLLARKMFGQKVALVSTALSAVSHLLIHFSRVSPTSASIDPLLGALSFLLVYSGLSSRRTFQMALAGIVMGLGLYFYVAARVLIFIFIAFLFMLWIFNRQLLRENWHGLLALVAAYLLMAAPILVWLATDPYGFNARTNQLGIFQNGWFAAEISNQNSPVWAILWKQFSDAFLMFNFYSPEWFYQAVIPALGPVTGVAFIFGLLASIIRIRDPRFALLNCWFWVTLILGQVIMIYPSTRVYRTLVLMPAVTILAGVALVRLADGLFRWWPRIRRFAPVVFLTLALIAEAGWNLFNYFGIWNVETRYSDPLSRLAGLIGEFMGNQPPGTMVYVAETPSFQPDQWSSLEYLRKSTPYEEIEKSIADAKSDFKFGQQTVFIFPPERINELSGLMDAFPGGKIVQEYYGGNLYFTAYVK